MDKDKLNEKIFTHMLYIMGLLGLLIILLTAVKWYDIPNLPNLLNFALAITSLVLGLVAIFYAIISTERSSRNTAQIQTSSESIGKDAAAIEKASCEFQTVAEETKSSLRNLEGTVEKSIGELETAFQNGINSLDQAFQERLVKIEGGLQATSSALEKMGANQSTSQPNFTPANNDSEPEISEKQLISFLNASSWNGLLALDFCVLAHQKKVAASIKEWTNSSRFMSDLYAYGYMVAACALGLMAIEQVKFTQEGGFILKIPWISPKILSNLDEVLEAHIAADKEYGAPKRGDLDTLKKFFDQISEVPESTPKE